MFDPPSPPEVATDPPIRERIMGNKVGQIFQRIVGGNGVKFKMSASVEKATPSCTFLCQDLTQVLPSTNIS